MESEKKEKQDSLPMTFFKAVGITLLAVGLSLVLFQPFSFSAASLLSTHERKDFNMTDFYNIVADSRLVRDLDRDIVLINIDDTDRDDITELLRIIPMCEPRLIGLDVTFNVPRVGDSMLIAAIRNCPNLVQVAVVDYISGDDQAPFRLGERSYFYDSISYMPHGAANLPVKFEGASVREFPVWFDMPFGKRFPSFPVALALQIDSAAVARLEARGNQRELIDYPSRTYEVIDWRDIIDNVDHLKGKIVLLGAVSEEADFHRTPVRDRMAGIEIHARALGTILRGDYLTKVSDTVNMAIACLLCFLLAVAHLRIPVSFKAFLLRILQFGLLFLIIHIGYWLFVGYRIIVDLSYTLLMLTFLLFACDIWIGFPGMLRWIWEKIGKLKKKKIKDETES